MAGKGKQAVPKLSVYLLIYGGSYTRLIHFVSMISKVRRYVESSNTLYVKIKPYLVSYAIREKAMK